MKKALLLIILILSIIASSCFASTQQESRGFDTPTECAEAVFEALQKQDISAIEDCYAIPEMARLFDFRIFCERMQVIPASYPYMPSTSELGIAYTEASIRSSLYQQLVFSSALLADQEYGDKMTSNQNYLLKGEDDYAFLSFLETPSTLEGFSLLRLDYVLIPAVFPKVRDIYYSGRNGINRVKQMSMWHVENHQELILVADTPNISGIGRILIPLRFVQIEGKWLADPTGSNLRGILGISSTILFMRLSDIQ